MANIVDASDLSGIGPVNSPRSPPPPRRGASSVRGGARAKQPRRGSSRGGRNKRGPGRLGRWMRSGGMSRTEFSQALDQGPMTACWHSRMAGVIVSSLLFGFLVGLATSPHIAPHHYGAAGAASAVGFFALRMWCLRDAPDVPPDGSLMPDDASAVLSPLRAAQGGDNLELVEGGFNVEDGTRADDGTP